MFTEQSLHDHPSLVKAFTGIAAEQFWILIQQMTERLPNHNQQRLARSGRVRAEGGGRTNDLSLVLRTMLVLTYLRLHIPQATVAALFGATQSDVSRELRRLLALITACLPCPQIWELQEQAQTPVDAQPPSQLVLAALAQERVLIDATEQRVSRPKDRRRQKEYYSGKKQMHTLKTQLVSDGSHFLHALSVAVGGAMHDKALCDRLHTLDHLPDGCEADADKGYQGLSKQVSLVALTNQTTGVTEFVPRLRVLTPFKKPKGQTLNEEQLAFNRAVGSIRIRIEHCIGWMKNWAILANRFRCSHTIYTAIVQAVCGFVNAQTQRWQAAKPYCA